MLFLIHRAKQVNRGASMTNSIILIDDHKLYTGKTGVYKKKLS